MVANDTDLGKILDFGMIRGLYSIDLLYVRRGCSMSAIQLWGDSEKLSCHYRFVSVANTSTPDLVRNVDMLCTIYSHLSGSFDATR
jgi:hypothetical protein